MICSGPMASLTVTVIVRNVNRQSIFVQQAPLLSGGEDLSLNTFQSAIFERPGDHVETG